jgi:hypothetical protein
MSRRVTETDAQTGEVFEGRTVDGVRHGKGRVTFADGSAVEGIFRDGEVHGPGCYRSADGTELRASFMDGVPEGPVRLVLTLSPRW